MGREKSDKMLGGEEATYCDSAGPPRCPATATWAVHAHRVHDTGGEEWV